MYRVDEALAAVGFGKLQALVLAYAGLGWFAEAAELMLISFVGQKLSLSGDFREAKRAYYRPLFLLAC